MMPRDATVPVSSDHDPWRSAQNAGLDGAIEAVIAFERAKVAAA
jgi:hypothetical protein